MLPLNRYHLNEHIKILLGRLQGVLGQLHIYIAF